MTSFMVGALVLIAGLIAVILVTRRASMGRENTSRSARARGFRFFLGWFVVGGLVALVTFVMFLIAAIGGVSAPPDIWMFFYSLGIVVLPILLTLGGVPAAIQIARGKAWRKTASVALAVCVTSWVVVVGVVLLAPSILGWSR